MRPTREELSRAVCDHDRGPGPTATVLEAVSCSGYRIAEAGPGPFLRVERRVASIFRFWGSKVDWPRSARWLPAFTRRAAACDQESALRRVSPQRK
jgi:hypothetical protein